MTNLTFDQLPEAVRQLHLRLNSIEELLRKLEPSQSSVNDDLLTVAQVANVLNLSIPTIYGLTSRNEIPYSKKGKRLYFSHQEVTEWVKTGRRKTKTEIAKEVSHG